jgi:Fis family transcriptional regulator, factor for inversion stimulation protein
MKTLAACETNAGDWSQVAVLRPHRTEVLRECVHSSVTDYLRQMDGHEVHDLHRLFMEEVERPLLETILRHTRGNQTVAAKLLGMSRSTLRKRMAVYDINEGS